MSECEASHSRSDGLKGPALLTCVRVLVANKSMNFYTNLLAAVASVLLLAVAPRAVRADEPVVVVPPPVEAVSKVDSTYIIGPGDTLKIFVWRQPDLSTEVPVRPDGKVSTPLVEDIVAVGKTPSQLAREMEKVLSEYVRSP